MLVKLCIMYYYALLSIPSVAWWATERERNDGDVVYASTSRQELRGLYLRFRDYDFVPQRKCVLICKRVDH